MSTQYNPAAWGESGYAPYPLASRPARRPVSPLPTLSPQEPEEPAAIPGILRRKYTCVRGRESPLSAAASRERERGEFQMTRTSIISDPIPGATKPTAAAA